MDTAHTVLEFSKIQFVGVWHRSFDGDKAIYTPSDHNKNEGILHVICREPVGVTTYDFFISPQNIDLRESSQAWVNWAENLVHIPAICKKSINEDTLKCSG